MSNLTSLLIDPIYIQHKMLSSPKSFNFINYLSAVDYDDKCCQCYIITVCGILQHIKTGFRESCIEG